MSYSWFVICQALVTFGLPLLLLSQAPLHTSLEVSLRPWRFSIPLNPLIYCYKIGSIRLTIINMLRNVFSSHHWSNIPTPRRVLKKGGAAKLFLNQSRGVRNVIVTQTINNSRRNAKQKFTIFSDNRDRIFPNFLGGSDFLNLVCSLFVRRHYFGHVSRYIYVTWMTRRNIGRLVLILPRKLSSVN